MSYKNEFIQLGKEAFRKRLEIQKAKDASYKLIDDYFSSIFEALKSEADVAGSDLKFTSQQNHWQIVIKQSRFSVSLTGDQITVEAIEQGHGYKDILTFDGSNYRSRTYGTELSEELLDQYLKDSFDSAIHQIS